MNFFNLQWFDGSLEQNPLIVPYSARDDIQHGVLEAPTPPRLLSSLHCNTLICSQTTFLPPSPPPSPINHPSLHLLLFILHLSPLWCLNSVSKQICLLLLHLFLCNTQLISPCPPASLFSPVLIAASFSSRPRSVCACLPP